jgi:hypothetical protein
MSDPGLVDITGRLRSPAAMSGRWAGCAPPNNAALRRRSADRRGDHPRDASAGARPVCGPYPSANRDLVARRVANQRRARAHRVRSGPEDRVGAGPRRQGREAKDGRDGRLGMGARRSLDRASDPAAHWSAVLHPRATNSGPRVVSDSARRELRQLAVQAGVRRRFAQHQLRHAHATEMAHEGIPLPVIQRQLGMRISASHRFISRASTTRGRRFGAPPSTAGDLRERRPAAIADHRERRVIGASSSSRPLAAPPEGAANDVRQRRALSRRVPVGAASFVETGESRRSASSAWSPMRVLDEREPVDETDRGPVP